MIKKILMTADTVGGVWTYAIELCRELRKHDVSIALATMGQPLSKEQKNQAAALENVAVFESAFRLEWMDDPWEDTSRAGTWLLQIRDRFQPDLIHLNGYVHGNLPWNLPVLVVGHSCVFSWWQAVHGQMPPAEWSRYRDSVTCGLRAANVVAAPSNSMLASLSQYYGSFSSSCVVANGRDPELFHVREKLPIIIGAGRLWDPAKNVGSLLDIAGQLTWPIYVAWQERFEQHTESLSNRERIRYLGHLPQRELADWMARAAIFAMPARYEPFGLTALEAAFSGCALVLGDIPSLRENWEGAAVFVTPDNKSKLVETLEGLINDASYLKALGRWAQERAQQFTATRMAGEYMRIYTALCNSFSFITR